MPIAAEDIATLSRLLDQALDLDAAQREEWLAALAPEHKRHAAQLREMLAARVEGDADSPLSALPRLATDDELARTGELVGPYRLLREIGHGGMGSVWLAERADGRFKRQVALKLPRLAWGAGLAERMAREREIGMLLEHPNIARLYDAGLDDRGRPYLALEYVDGQPLDAWCEAQALDVRSRLRLFLQVVRAVAYAHGRLVVHRDLKPSNVLVSADGQAHLLDFGIAKLLGDAASSDAGLTQQQGPVLTLHYAAPEQVAGEAITVACDVYSLGVLLYEVLTGTLPIAPKRSTLGAVEDAVLQGDAPLASSRVKDRTLAKALRGEIDAILAKAMQREPSRRYATADALAQDIERHLNGETVAAQPDSVVYRLRKSVRRHWVGVAAAAAVMVAVLSGSGVAVVQANRAAQSAERERVVKEFVADVFRVNSRVDPKNAALRPASSQSLLEGGAQLIQQRFKGQPELQAELYGVVGGVFSDMGAYKQAADYATRRIEVLTLLRADKIEQTKALLQLAQTLMDDDKLADAELRARRALRLSAGNASLALDATLLLARVQYGLERDADAAATVTMAEALLASQGTDPSIAMVRAMDVRACLMATQNQLDQAVLLRQKAIDMALQVEGPLSKTAVDIRLDLARWLSQTLQADLARQVFDAGVDTLRQLGGAHAVRAEFEVARFAERRRLGGRHSSPAEALAVLERSRAALTASPLPMPTWWVPQIEFWIGAVKADYGDIAGALPLMEAHAPVLRAAFELPSQRFLMTTRLGRTARDAGKHDLADRLLRESLDLRRQFGEGSHPYAADDYVVIAWNLVMQGRLQEAESVLKDTPSFEPMRGEGGSALGDRHSLALVWAKAKVRLASGDAVGALALIRRSAPEADETPFNDNDYDELRGEALCSAGETAEGLSVLKHRVAAVEGADTHAHAPRLARMRAVTGICALAGGDRSLAMLEAHQARAAFTAQPGVSPYYKAPLFKLERALGLRLPPV